MTQQPLEKSSNIVTSLLAIVVKFDLKNITSIDRCPKLYLLKYGMRAFLQIRAHKCLPEKFYAIFYTTDSLYTRMDMQDCHSTSLEPLVHCQNVGQNVKTFSKYHFYRSYFGRCSSELAQLVPLPFYWGRSNFYSHSLHDLSVAIPRCYNMCMSNVSFLTQLDSRILCL